MRGRSVNSTETFGPCCGMGSVPCVIPSYYRPHYITWDLTEGACNAGVTRRGGALLSIRLQNNIFFCKHNMGILRVTQERNLLRRMVFNTCIASLNHTITGRPLF
jgi:hypothetical protein